jgi:hypothetical protein
VAGEREIQHVPALKPAAITELAQKACRYLVTLATITEFLLFGQMGQDFELVYPRESVGAMLGTLANSVSIEPE